jgi:hypothetical protein
MSAPLVPQPPELVADPRRDANALAQWMELLRRNISVRAARNLPDPLPDAAPASDQLAAINAILRFLKGA